MEDDRVKVLHPEHCLRYRDDWGIVYQDCVLAGEIDAIGFDSVFPDGISKDEEGIWLVDARVIIHGAGPWGPEEYDVEIDMQRLIRWVTD